MVGWQGTIRYPRPTIHPTTSYTDLFIHRTPSYYNLLRPTLDCSAILPYRTLSYILPCPTLDCLVALELRLYILPLAEQSSVGRGRMYDRVVGWGRTGYIGQEGCRGWGRIDEQFSVGRCRIYSRTGIPYPTTSYKSSCIPNTSLCTPSYPILPRSAFLTHHYWTWRTRHRVSHA